MAVTLDEVRRTAQLARLDIPEAEEQRVLAAFNQVLDWFRTLAEVDVEGVEPMTHAVDLSLRLREDQAGPQLGTAAALASAPRSDGEHFVVPRVIAHDKESGR